MEPLTIIVLMLLMLRAWCLIATIRAARIFLAHGLPPHMLVPTMSIIGLTPMARFIFGLANRLVGSWENITARLLCGSTETLKVRVTTWKILSAVVLFTWEILVSTIIGLIGTRQSLTWDD